MYITFFVKDIKSQLRSSLPKETYENQPADPDTGYISNPPFTEVLPGSSMVLFEGGSGEDDTVRIERYHGEKHGQHDTRRTYQAFLEHVIEKEQHYDIFTSEFTNLVPRISIAHNQEEHGRLRIVSRFGKLYYFDGPPVWEMKVKDINEYEKKTMPFQKGQRYFRSSFIPKHMPHKSSEVHLIRQGYQFVQEERKIMIQVHPVGSQSKGRCTVVQDEEFRFLAYRYPDVKWIVFNVIRAEKDRRDVRIAVQSVRETTEEDDEGVMKYKEAKILQRNSKGDVTVNDDYRQEARFVREKHTRIFKKPSADESGIKLEVQLSKTREYNGLNKGTGKFEDIKDWKDEVIIHPEITDINEVDEKFAQSLIDFCYAFEKEITST